MRSPKRRGRAKRLLAVASTVAFAVAACGPSRDPVAERRAGRDAIERGRSELERFRRPVRRRRARSRSGTVRLALDWTPNTNHTGFYVAQANGWYGDAGVDLQILPYGSTTPEALIARRPGGVRDQLPGRSHLRGRGRRADRVGHGHPPAHRPGHRGPRLVRHHPSARPRRQDLRRLRRPAGGADPQRGDQGRRREGHVQDRHPRHRRVRRAVRQARRLRDHVRGLGGHRGRRARDPAPDLRLRRLRLPGLLPGRPGLRQPLADRPPDLAKAFVGATVRGFEMAADDPDAAAAILVAQNPGVFDGNPALPKASQEFLAVGRLPARRRRCGRPTDARASGRATRASCTTSTC